MENSDETRKRFKTRRRMAWVSFWYVLGGPILTYPVPEPLIWMCGAIILGYLGLSTIHDINAMKGGGKK